ncbi:porphobilinogen synthase [Candidatus Acidulodesulfobacterium sp. H_13]|uniref:porphobilinogen synthase n=1 Tax=Candidatus Acidulodesulfobacterium sp. H_13 TaxID=3395470 RepID=UPI003AF90445
MNSGYPIVRPRRMRSSLKLSGLIKETTLDPSKFIMPYFVIHGNSLKEPIMTMPDQFRYSIDKLLEELKSVIDMGIGGILLFGIPKHKDELGSESYSPDGIIQQTLRAIKDVYSDLLVVTDVCLCDYTSHGHCGIVDENGYVKNDETLEYLAKIAVSYAKAGADIIAPSDMMDGRVKKIRESLDDEGLVNTPIMAYSSKYASCFYEPFRDAADCLPKFGNRKSYQMDFSNSDEAILEVGLDLDEGADIVMVKPALSYLDIIYKLKQTFKRPLAVYNVSGEYSMIKAASKLGYLKEDAAVIEMFTSFKRAGADIIISYYSLHAAKILG